MKGMWSRLVFCLCLVILVAACSRCDRNYVPKITNTGGVRVFFTPSTDCEKNIVKAIDNANKMDIAVYSITNPVITNSLIAAHNRGAAIRIVTDKQMAKGKGSLVGKIRSAGIPVLTNKKHKIEHNKFAVFDDVHVVSGSYNWTTNASKYNSENCIFFDQQNKEYSHRFEYLWNIYR
jgi:phosphatidylserine/phosphatidylglycerophosphate/cardiolipin synthase-like enzyme